MKQQRIYLIDLSLARIFAIYWVVLVQHNFEIFRIGWVAQLSGDICIWPYKNFTEITQYITMITMPICFFISGYILQNSQALIKQKAIEFIQKKIKRLLIPCYILGAFFSLLTTNSLSVHILYGYSHLWFIFYLFLMFLLTYFVRKLAINISLRQSFSVIIILLLIYKVSSIFELYKVANFIRYYIWFIGGFIYPIHIDHFIKKKINITLMFLAALIGFIILQLNCHNTSIISLYSFIYTAITIAFILLIAQKINLYFPHISTNNLFNILNRTSYGVYIFHMIYLFLFYSLINWTDNTVFLVNHVKWLSSVISLITIPCSIITTYLLNKTTWLKL